MVEHSYSFAHIFRAAVRLDSTKFTVMFCEVHGSLEGCSPLQWVMFMILGLTRV